MSEKRWGPVLWVLVLTPLVIAPLVLLGVYLGFYLGGVLGFSKAIMAIALSTLGFLASMVILVRVVIVRIVKRWQARA